MSGLRKLYRLGAIAVGLLAAATAAAQNVTIGGEDVDTFFAVASGNKKIKIVLASSISPSGQVVIPPEVAGGLKQDTKVKIRYRKNRCTGRKQILIIPPGTTPEQIAEEEKSRREDCGGWLILPGDPDVPWGSGTNLTIDYSRDVPTVTTGATQTGVAATLGMTAANATRIGPVWDLGVYSGGHVLNEFGQSGSAYAFQSDLAYLFHVSRVSVGFEGGVQYLQTTPVAKLGGVPPPGGTAPFSKTATGMRNFSFGARLGKTFGRIGFDVEGGPLVGNVETRTVSGICFRGSTGAVFCSSPATPTLPASITSSHANGFGSYLGAQASYRLFNRFSLVAGCTYDRTYPGSQADVHALVFYAGFRARFP